MSDWTRGEVTTTKVVYTVWAGPNGAAWNQVQNALDAAKSEARRLNGGNPLSDDAIWVEPKDDAIVIWFEKPAASMAGKALN